MLLSRKRSGVYHLFFDDESGKRHTRSTGARTKPEAIEFLRAFNAEEAARRRALTGTNSERFTTKSKRARVVPLVDDARAVLFARREGATDEELVFTRKGRPMGDQWVSREFKKVVRVTTLPDALHFHSLGCTFASWLVQGGVSLYQIAKLLGHSSTAGTEQYALSSDMHGVLGLLHFEN